MTPERRLLGRDALALASAVARYWPRIERTTRSELERWRTHAQAIPDPTLRRHALTKLDGQRANVLAAATFGTLVARRHRPPAVRLMVAFQAMYDYLDAVSEQPVDDPLSDGRRLHRSLIDVVDPPARPVDYYEHHPQHDDGGYLARLVATCQAAYHSLPSSGSVRRAARAAAARCGESQTRTHAIAALGSGQLEEWAAADATDGFRWWETAAGAASSLTIHALFALAARPVVAPAEVAKVEAAYYPAISALSTLLDSLADYTSDDPDTDHRYIAYYPSLQAAVERLSEIVDEGVAAARGLPYGPGHVVIIAGVACFYLTGPGASNGAAHAAAPQILEAVGPIRRPIGAVLRTLRILHGKGA